MISLALATNAPAANNEPADITRSGNVLNMILAFLQVGLLP
jgi:hypothetical protein